MTSWERHQLHADQRIPMAGCRECGDYIKHELHLRNGTYAPDCRDCFPRPATTASIRTDHEQHLARGEQFVTCDECRDALRDEAKAAMEAMRGAQKRSRPTFEVSDDARHWFKTTGWGELQPVKAGDKVTCLNCEGRGYTHNAVIARICSICKGTRTVKVEG